MKKKKKTMAVNLSLLFASFVFGCQTKCPDVYVLKYQFLKRKLLQMKTNSDIYFNTANQSVGLQNPKNGPAGNESTRSNY